MPPYEPHKPSIYSPRRKDPQGPRLGARDSSEEGRLRARKPRKQRVPGGFGRRKHLEFVNPYPWMSSVEAMVHLELERRGIPFSWRHFDGVATTFQYLIPDFQPEFTLKEHRLVILILGEFFGTLPSILEKNALAQVLLEEDGWKCAILNEFDIRERGAEVVLNEAAPVLLRPVAYGQPRVNPHGVPDFMARRRQQLQNQGLERSQFALDPDQQKKESSRNGSSGRARLRRRRRSSDADRGAQRSGQSPRRGR